MVARADRFVRHLCPDALGNDADSARKGPSSYGAAEHPVSDTLFWSKRGHVACRIHAPDLQSDRWQTEAWSRFQSQRTAAMVSSINALRVLHTGVHIAMSIVALAAHRNPFAIRCHSRATRRRRKWPRTARQPSAARRILSARYLLNRGTGAGCCADRRDFQFTQFEILAGDLDAFRRFTRGRAARWTA